MFKTNHIYLGDNLDVLSDTVNFPDHSVDCCITSPPYFQLRDYNGCGMGNESDVDEYLDKLKSLFSHLYRVVKPTGTIVINLGDKYENGGLKLLPYRFAIAILDEYKDNIRLINDLTWVKTNPTPRQDNTKLIQATEPFFIFAKNRGYVFNKNQFQAVNSKTSKTVAGRTYGETYYKQINDSELTDDQKKNARKALTEAIQDVRDEKISGIRMKIKGIHALAYGGQEGGRNNAIERDGFTIIRLLGEKMKRDVIHDDLIYEVIDDKSDFIEQNVETIKGNQHPAVFPTKLIEEIILLLTPVNGIVLDPFMGSGTTGLAANNTGRRYVGIEIDPIYHAYAADRLQIRPLVFELDELSTG